MMKPSLFIRATAVLAALLLATACAPRMADEAADEADGDPDTLLRLQADTPPLRLAARQALRGAGVGIRGEGSPLPLLQLSESVERSIESLESDGSVSSYHLSYTLTYQYDGSPQGQIQRTEVINHDENLYRASTNQQRQMVDSLRRSALTQMIISLQLH